MKDQPATDPSAGEQKSAKKIEDERLEDEKKYREHMEKILADCKYEGIDDRRYSFEFQDHFFIFRIPAFIEEVKIKAIHAAIAYKENIGTFSSTMEIAMTGDVDFVSNVKLLTHLSEAVVLEKFYKKSDMDTSIDHKKYVEGLDHAERQNLGHTIRICERDFLERKKKV